MVLAAEVVLEVVMEAIILILHHMEKAVLMGADRVDVEHQELAQSE
jgi:hypothetical protein